MTTFVRCSFVIQLSPFCRLPLWFLASHSVSCAPVCSHVLTRKTGLKGQTGLKPPLEVVWLKANLMRICPECACHVDAQMRIEAN